MKNERDLCAAGCKATWLFMSTAIQSYEVILSV